MKKSGIKFNYPKFRANRVKDISKFTNENHWYNFGHAPNAEKIYDSVQFGVGAVIGAGVTDCVIDGVEIGAKAIYKFAKGTITSAKDNLEKIIPFTKKKQKDDDEWEVVNK